jgi:hypothetical protein
MPYSDRTGHLQLKLTPEEWAALDRVRSSMDLVQPGVRLSRAAVVRNLVLRADHDLTERFEAFVVEVAKELGDEDPARHQDLLRIAWEAGRAPNTAAELLRPYLKPGM